MIAPHEEWLDKAEDDLRFAEIGLREAFYTQVCFLSQQSIEKTLKGALVSLNRSYPKIHSLRELAKKLSELDLKIFLEPLTLIDGYYVPLRYPDAAPGMKADGEPNKEEAGEALSTAKKIFDLVSEFLKKKT